jgi:hypothetical protein
MSTHDYFRMRTWGHDYTWRPDPGSGGRTGTATGWGPDTGGSIVEGDHLLLRNGDRSSRYRVESVSYYSDPKDMWTARLRHEPAQEQQT